MKRRIGIICTLDTKGPEAAFMADLVVKRGHETVIIDVGMRGAAAPRADFTNRDVAAAAGTSPEELLSASRGKCMEEIAKGAGRIVTGLYNDGKLDAIAGIGGNQGSSIASAAMRALPIGFPKYLISTVASGNIRPYIGYSDIIVTFSVSDLVGGINPVSRSVLTNGVSALIGMAEHGEKVRNSAPEKTIALSALGNTEHTASRIFNILRGRGYKVIVFHASGAGGSAMEDLIEKGVFGGVVDLTPHEIAEEVAGVGAYIPIRPGRLSVAGKNGIPQVISMGGLEYYCGGSMDSLPREHRETRKIYMHNPLNANVKLSHEEMEKTGALMAERINTARGPVNILVPMKGWSGYGSAGGPFHDPEANRLLLKNLYASLEKGKANVQEIDASINDEVFADACAEAVIGLMSGRLISTGGKT
jgi:uncharacterized protein (UPF0261 family)